LLNGFEERFGQLLAWKGYPYGDPDTVSMERVWQRLEKKVVRDISRRVVSLASFKGDFAAECSHYFSVLVFYVH